MSRAEEKKTEVGKLRYFVLNVLGVPETEGLRIILKHIEEGSDSAAVSAVNNLVSIVLAHKVGALKADVRAALDRTKLPGEQI